jgi:signal recognition particle GTPase
MQWQVKCGKYGKSIILNFDVLLLQIDGDTRGGAAISI